ncbi:MAG: Na+/H+ antiporter subunit E [Clostridia bacterium]
MKSIFLAYFIFVLLIWTFLTTELFSIGTAIGIVLAIVTGVIVVKALSYYLKSLGFDNILEKSQGPLSLIKSFGALSLFIPYFIFLIMRSAINVIWLVFVPHNIKPGIVEYKTELNDPYSITLLASLITLTPGTMTIDYDTDKHNLFVHALCIRNREDRICMESDISQLENWVKRVITWL